MTMKTAACAMAVALLAGTASFAAPAAAQGTPMPPRHANVPSSHAKKLYMSAIAEYDAGLRQGSAYSSDNAYLRGFRDGASTEAYSSRPYVVDSVAGNPTASYPDDSSYLRDAGYDPDTGAYSPNGGYSSSNGGYSSYNGGYSSYYGRSARYDDANGYVSDRYDAGYVPSGLMNVAVAPAATGPSSEAQAAHLSYCAARYQSFDPASNTFLAYDGNRYFCH